MAASSLECAVLWLFACAAGCNATAQEPDGSTGQGGGGASFTVASSATTPTTGAGAVSGTEACDTYCEDLGSCALAGCRAECQKYFGVGCDREARSLLECLAASSGKPTCATPGCNIEVADYDGCNPACSTDGQEGGDPTCDSKGICLGHQVEVHCTDENGPACRCIVDGVSTLTCYHAGIDNCLLDVGCCSAAFH